MKAKLICVMVLLTMTLAGCGGSAKVIEGEVKSKETGSSAGTEAGSEVKAEGTAENEADQSAENAVKYKGYAYTYNGVIIEMDAEAEPIVEALGEADAYFEAPSCAFEGIDKMYTYKGFELDTYPTDDKDYVSSVIFKDDTITTIEGIGIGDSVENLEVVYGTEWADEDGAMVFEKDGMKLCFITDGDAVVSVEYRSGVLDE